jgi:nucleotidyltransferase substrate binding protein (TIGR01987 family)
MTKPLEVALRKLREASLRLDEGVQEVTSELGQDGVIQRFEFTFELLWKTIKIFMEEKGDQNSKTPKDSLKAAFRIGLIKSSEEQLFLGMLEDRNTSSHVYDRQEAAAIFARIRDVYLPAVKTLITRLSDQFS